MRRFSLLLAAALLVPPAAADAPRCGEVTDAPWNPVGVYTYGDITRGLEIWLESNQDPGLQRQACAREDGTVVGSDQLVTGTLSP